MQTQLPLDFRLRDEATLERFVMGTNRELVSAIASLAAPNQPGFLYLTGGDGVGKTHLLQAISRQCRSSFYLPLREIAAPSADMFDGFAVADLICLDDIDHLAGQADLELALFSLINQMKEQAASFVVSAGSRPGDCGFGLKDLVSRLNACTQYHVHGLNDEHKRQYLTGDAKARGLTLSQEVIDWIFVHTPRDMQSLTGLMNRLDRESLAAQRRITIPFLKTVLKA